jgi:hypothetical protein
VITYLQKLLRNVITLLINVKKVGKGKGERDGEMEPALVMEQKSLLQQIFAGRAKKLEIREAPLRIRSGVGNFHRILYLRTFLKF